MWEEEKSGNKDFLNRAVTLEPLPLLGSNLDEFVKSQKSPGFVIPAKAEIQGNHPAVGLDSRLRRSDGLGDFLRDHQS